MFWSHLWSMADHSYILAGTPEKYLSKYSSQPFHVHSPNKKNKQKRKISWYWSMESMVAAELVAHYHSTLGSPLISCRAVLFTLHLHEYAWVIITLVKDRPAGFSLHGISLGQIWISLSMNVPSVLQKLYLFSYSMPNQFVKPAYYKLSMAFKYDFPAS